MPKNQPTITTKVLASALYNKSKRTFNYKKSEVWEQAKYFSPVYRDFIYKIITNSALKIVSNPENKSYIVAVFKGEPADFKLSKRHHNTIYTDINECTELPHELGHAVDFWFGLKVRLTSTIILEDNKTLYDIFTEEFESKYQSIYNLIMDEYKNIIDSTIKPGAFDILTKNISLYKRLKNFKADLKNPKITAYRRQIQKKLYDCGFVEVYYQIYTKNCFSILNAKYSPVIDALSSKFDLSELFLFGHQKSYYLAFKTRPVEEFFANLFCGEVTSKYYEFENLEKLLPKSFCAFEKLFSIVYERILNNRKFTDLNIKIV